MVVGRVCFPPEQSYLFGLTTSSHSAVYQQSQSFISLDSIDHIPLAYNHIAPLCVGQFRVLISSSSILYHHSHRHFGQLSQSSFSSLLTQKTSVYSFSGLDLAISSRLDKTLAHSLDIHWINLGSPSLSLYIPWQSFKYIANDYLVKEFLFQCQVIIKYVWCCLLLFLFLFVLL